MEDELGGAAVGVGDESDLGVDDLEEEIARAFGEYREGGLAGDLYGQMIAVASNGQIDIGSELVSADVAAKQIRIDGDFIYGLWEGAASRRD